MNNTDLSHCTNIIWDWNGTLLNDLDVCVKAINLLLEKRNLETLSAERYTDIFTFPVKDYYEVAGFDFDKEPFESVAVEFMDHYFRLVVSAGLHNSVNDTLKYFKSSGRKQVILSAMEHGELINLVKKREIDHYFENIFGIQDHLAHGKLEMARKAILETGFDRSVTCLIGDTLHDAEVAGELGIQCILVADGHQSGKRLKSSGYPVIQSLNEIRKVF